MIWQKIIFKIFLIEIFFGFAKSGKIIKMEKFELP